MATNPFDKVPAILAGLFSSKTPGGNSDRLTILFDRPIDAIEAHLITVMMQTAMKLLSDADDESRKTKPEPDKERMRAQADELMNQIRASRAKK